MTNYKYFIQPFANVGDKTTIPDTIPGDGTINYPQGFPSGYSTPPPAPSSLFVPREGMNEILFDLTSTLQVIQQQGIPTFITASMNDGTPFPYALNALAYHNNVVYQSLITNNTSTPPGATWGVVGYIAPGSYVTPSDLQSGNYVTVTAGGTANAITLTPALPYTSYTAGTTITFIATATNTGPTTVNISGLGNAPVRVSDTPSGMAIALKAGMIIAGGIYTLVSNGSVLQLINPSISTCIFSQCTRVASSTPIGGNTDILIAYDNPIGGGDPYSWFDSTDSSINVTIEGVYEISGMQVITSFTDVCAPNIRAYVNGSPHTNIAQNQVDTGGFCTLNGSVKINLAANSKVQLYINPVTFGSGTLTLTSGNFNSRFSVQFIGAA